MVPPVPSPTPPSLPPSRRVRARAARRASPLWRVLGFLFRLLCTPLILLDELVRPLYRPLIARLAALRIMHAFERWIAARSVTTILVLLVVPYVTIEPLKIVALVWIADGWARAGTVLFLLAYLVSFVIIERIYSAGRAKLMTVPWMAWVIVTLTNLRDRVVTALRLDRLKQALRRRVREVRRGLERLWR
ncbi:hypothetical protein [Ancylobacter polymorphus]|uniref:Uncharacterized protein n=1 Tax=Ancylobacter polymorphus TaxID=223390 RepID=A0A9E7A7X3_9HYPH|nr:hypothetical protein [Ancylobacter polymorphus]UOK72409.1 hypothetical protein K9D25_06825 [Ancylobacter polymorphus]